MQRGFTFQLGIIILVVLVTGCTAYRAGNLQLVREKYEGAIPHYLEDLSQNPDHWQARERLGFAYLKIGQLDKAIGELTRVLEQKPGEPYATYYIGLAWLDKGEYGNAVEMWKSYRNRKEPVVEREIKRHVTLLEIAESVRLARQALGEEEKLRALPPKPGTVVVFYFKDVSPDDRFRHLQKALAAMIITDLSQVESLQVVERMRVQFLLAEMELGQTGIVDERTAPRAGRLLGTESLVVGTMEPGSLRVKTSVASTSRKDLVGAFSVAEEEERFFELEKEIVFQILKVLRVSLTPEEKRLVESYHTKNLEAVIYYGQALEALDAGNWKEAKSFFRKALIEDPEFMLARIGSESCPAPAAPSIAALGSLSSSELSAVLGEAVDVAMAEQALADQVGQNPAGQAVEGFGPEAVIGPSQRGGGEEPGTAGSIAVHW
jgi:tetratricopeptide (TPR) repeat protein